MFRVMEGRCSSVNVKAFTRYLWEHLRVQEQAQEQVDQEQALLREQVLADVEGSILMFA
jgi:hypothetical protein